MKSIHTLCIFVFCLLTASATAETVHYKIDTLHSGVSFKIRHFINKMPGTFKKFSGEISYNKENPAESKVTAIIQANSVNTGHDGRDANLLKEDYLNAAEYATITFESTEWIPAGEDRYKVTGNLTMFGQTHPVVLDVSFLGEIEAHNKFRSGWEATAKIDRTQWGFDAHSAMIGNEIEIELNIQAHRE